LRDGEDKSFFAQEGDGSADRVAADIMFLRERRFRRKRVQPGQFAGLDHAAQDLGELHVQRFVGVLVDLLAWHNTNVTNVDHVTGKAYVCLVCNIANICNVGYPAGMFDMTRHPESASSDDVARGPVGVALALLERHWPTCPALEDSIDTRAPANLERDPRYLIGRLQQALTVLLEQDLPPMDSQTALLSQALSDALAWRTHEGRACTTCDQSDDFCDACTADWAQAERYHELARALGAVDDWPTIARACSITDSAKPGT
jgi:hypothetical protein